MKELEIAERLIQLRIKYLIPMPEIARATGINKETLYKLESRENTSDTSFHTRLSEYMDNMELEAQHAATLRVPMTTGEAPTAYLHGDLAPGSILVVDEKPQLVVYRPKTTDGDADGLIPVNTNSMEPTYQKEWLIAISRMKSFRQPVWGKCHYIVDKKWRGFIKRLFQGATHDHVRLVSDNPDQVNYAPFELNWNDIEAMFTVQAAIEDKSMTDDISNHSYLKMFPATRNNIAGNLRYLRKKKGLTQLQARTCFSVTRSTWSSYENGLSTPAVDDLITFCRFFGVSLDDLILKDLPKRDNLIGHVKTLFVYTPLVKPVPSVLKQMEQLSIANREQLPR